MNNPFRDMPFPGSGQHGWRLQNGALVPDVPAAPVATPAASPPAKPPRTKSKPAPRRKARTRKE